MFMFINVYQCYYMFINICKLHEYYVLRFTARESGVDENKIIFFRYHVPIENIINTQSIITYLMKHYTNL